jgi:hypothetical protein
VVVARESIPQIRTTIRSASSRGGGRGRGMSNEKKKREEAEEGVGRQVNKEVEVGEDLPELLPKKIKLVQVKLHMTMKMHQFVRGRSRREYSTSPNSDCFMLFGDGRQQQNQVYQMNKDYIPDLNDHETTESKCVRPCKATCLFCDSALKNKYLASV